MKAKLALSFVVALGFVLGAFGIKDASAQAKPIIAVTEIDVKDLDGYLKDYAPKAQALIKKSGGKFLAVGQNVTSIEGAPPKKRVAIQQWDSMDTYKAYRASAEFKEVRKIGDKYAKFRTFTIEAAAP
jgi:uncharacterized protein (DUF1330 family)